MKRADADSLFELPPNTKSKNRQSFPPHASPKPGESVGHPESLFEVFTKE
jgi:hypothetical protein